MGDSVYSPTILGQSQKRNGLGQRRRAPNGYPQSGDNVGDQIVLDQRNLVFQLELALFQAGYLELINRVCRTQCIYRRVKIPMLYPEGGQSLGHLLFIYHITPRPPALSVPPEQPPRRLGATMFRSIEMPQKPLRKIGSLW